MVNDVERSVVRLNKDDMRAIMPSREVKAHKGDFGRVLIFAGSKGMVGAAVLTAIAAYRVGAGLVTVSLDEELFDIVQISVPTATCTTVESGLSAMAEYDAVAVGPGRGNNEATIRIVDSLLNRYKGKLVIDADALNCMPIMDSNYNVRLRDSEADIVITPHVGEAKRLIGIPEEEEIIREELADRLYEHVLGTTLIMKGAPTIVKSSDIRYLNTTGNHGMATGGSGDVLTGMIAGLAAAGLDIPAASRLAVYLHGLAGDNARKKFGSYSMLASDIADSIPEAILNLMSVKEMIEE